PRGADAGSEVRKRKALSGVCPGSSGNRVQAVRNRKGHCRKRLPRAWYLGAAKAQDEEEDRKTSGGLPHAGDGGAYEGVGATASRGSAVFEQSRQALVEKRDSLPVP